MASNYPPGVTGAEPEITGEFEPEFTDLSEGGLAMSALERSLTLRAINTERNLIACLYGHRTTSLGGWEKVSGFAPEVKFLDEPWDAQITALFQMEARLNGCECCFNNADDREHYHSPVCSPDYVEPDPYERSVESTRAGYGV